MTESRPRCVQFGCGWCAPAGWENLDASPVLRFERLPVIGRLWTKNAVRFPSNVRYGDIVNGLPVEPGSCDHVYCSHVLEHLALEECRRALANVFRMLKPGGTFRLVVPDLRRLAVTYIENDGYDAAMTFMRVTELGRERRPRGLRHMLATWFGRSSHLWMWDYRSIAHELTEAGFSNVRQAFYGDSTSSCYADVEDAARWQDHHLGIECDKPTTARPAPTRRDCGK
jgi:predicted SAM-dependent methyltransferase